MAVFRIRGFFRFFVTALLLLVIVSTILFTNTHHKLPYDQGRYENDNKHPCSSLNEECRTELARLIPVKPDRLVPSEAASNSIVTPTTTKAERRRSLVIFGDDRSGTTFLTRMFSEDPDIFSVYEPLWIPKRWLKDEPQRNKTKDVVGVVNALMSCHFIDNPMGMKFLANTNKDWAPGLFKNPFQSVPICSEEDKKKNTCPSPETVPRLVEQACLNHYKHSVTKLALVRVPQRKLSSFFAQVVKENPDTEIKVLHVVRDPRGSINSRIKLHWINDYQAKGFFIMPRDTCEGIVQNVKFGKSLEGELKTRYKLVRYKDIASSPVKTAQEIYNFAGFEMPENLIRWIIKATNPSEEELKKESLKAFSSVRNATANVEKWRKESPIERIRIIERECSELFDLLGLDRLT